MVSLALGMDAQFGLVEVGGGGALAAFGGRRNPWLATAQSNEAVSQCELP